MHWFTLCSLAALTLCLVCDEGAGAPRPTPPGRIDGLVRDPHRRPLADATLTLDSRTSTAPMRDIAPVTNAAGRFSWTDLPPGDYTLRATLPGYRSHAQKVSVRSGQTSRVEFVLEPASR